MKTHLMRLLAAAALAFSVLTACNTTDDNANNNNVTTDAGNNHKPDAGGEPECFASPTNNHEIINSCPPAGTTQITKNPTLPLNSDGTLPALP